MSIQNPLTNVYQIDDELYRLEAHEMIYNRQMNTDDMILDKFMCAMGELIECEKHIGVDRFRCITDCALKHLVSAHTLAKEAEVLDTVGNYSTLTASLIENTYFLCILHRRGIPEKKYKDFMNRVRNVRKTIKPYLTNAYSITR